MNDNAMTKPASDRALGEVTVYRADVDQNGDWYVWRRLSANGWATMRRCDTREDAVEMAATMNRSPGILD